MSTLRVAIEGIGAWSPWLTGWAALRAVLAGGAPQAVTTRPTAAILPGTERRRAPASVLLAIEVAQQAVTMSGRDATALACVFASKHGDEAITDAMCATLARAPAELSPTHFHNSVHNAPVGYWTIATGCRAPSSAIAAGDASFGAGLLEAATLAVAETRPVLLVASDTRRAGPLGTVTGCDEPFGCALVIAPAGGTRAMARCELTLAPRAAHAALPAPLDAWYAGNASAHSLTLLAAIAGGTPACRVAAAPTLDLMIAMAPPA